MNLQQAGGFFSPGHHTGCTIDCEMRYIWVLLVLVGQLVGPGVPARAVESGSPARLGMQLADLTFTLGKVASLPEGYRALDRWVLQIYTREQMLVDLAEGRELLRQWLRTAPEEKLWRNNIVALMEATDAAQRQLDSLPGEKLSEISLEELSRIMESLDAIRNGLEALDSAIRDHLPSSQARWEFRVALLCGPLLKKPGFPPSLPEEDARLLAEEVPEGLPQEAYDAVFDLLELLPRQTDGPSGWDGEEQRTEAERLARVILTALGANEEKEPAGGEG